MVTVVPPDPGFGEAFEGFGRGLVSGYQNRSDEKAIQNAIVNLGENPSPQDILKAVTGAKTHNPESKANFFKNYLGVGQLEAAQAKAARAGELTPYQKKRIELEESRLNKKPTITPYQEENLRLQRLRLDNETKKIANAKEKSSRDLPKMIASFTENYTKDVGLSAEDKLDFDKIVQQEYAKDDVDLTDAVTTAFEIMEQKQELLANVPVVDRPFLGVGLDQAKSGMTQVLQQLFNQGVTAKRELKQVARRGGWNGKEADEMIDQVKKVQAAPGAAPTSAAAEKPKVKFDPKNPEHIARAQAILAETGDREKANKILAEEFSK